MARLDKNLGILVQIFAILTGLNFLAGLIAAFLKPKVDIETYIFWGLTLLFFICCLLCYKKKDPESDGDKHRNLEYRKQQYERDCATEDNGQENGSVLLNIRRSVLSYKNMERTRIGHRKEFTVTARVNGVRDFHDRYTYSADQFDENNKSGICELTAPERKQSITNIGKSDVWVFYTIHSNEPLRQNHSGNFVMQMKTISDPKRRMGPYLSTGIYEPTEHLELELNFPPKLNLRDPKVKIYNNYSAGTEIDVVSPNEDPKHFECDYEHGKLLYKIDYPIYGYKYKMEWDIVS